MSATDDCCSQAITPTLGIVSEMAMLRQPTGSEVKRPEWTLLSVGFVFLPRILHALPDCDP